MKDAPGFRHSRTHKESTLLLLSGVLAVSGAFIAFMRLRNEHWTMAFVDAGIACIMLLLFAFVYVSRRTRTAGIVIALGFIGAALMSTLLLGASEVYWAFPALMVAYFMLDTRQATILATGFIGCFLVIVWGDLPDVGLARICLTLVVTVLLANAFALTNRRQMETLQHLVNIDPLTGAGNRRAQNLRLDAAIAIYARNQSPASVLIVDIDHFKRVNDAHGHIVGDQLLVELCELIRRSTRATEHLYRYGGEEFVLIAEHTGLQSAINVAEKLRAQIARKLFACDIRLTVSIGVAELQHDESRQEWMGRADAALYRAKGCGRNQVVVAEHPAAGMLLQLPVVERSGEAEKRFAALSR